MARTRTLDVIDIDEPCTEDWDRMIGRGAVRFCRVCRLNVFDLSQMSAEEAAEIVEESEERLCVRFLRRADGTVVTDDCAPARRAARERATRRSLRFVGAAIAAGVSAAVGVAAFAGLRSPPALGPAPRKIVEYQPSPPLEPARPPHAEPATPPVVPAAPAVEHPRPLMGRLVLRPRSET